MRRLILLLLMMLSGALDAAEPLVFIGYPGLPKADPVVLQRLYTGRTVAIADQPATPINYPVGHPLRQRFLDTIMGQTEEQYTGYWLVRRYVGKGAPPLELADEDAVVAYVQSMPGAVGYVSAGKVPAGANVVLRR